MTDTTVAITLAWNAALSVFTILISMIGKSYRDQFNELKLKVADDAIALSKVQVLVAGEYVTREEFRDEIRNLAQGIYGKLDGVERRLNDGLERRKQGD